MIMWKWIAPRCWYSMRHTPDASGYFRLIRIIKRLRACLACSGVGEAENVKVRKDVLTFCILMRAKSFSKRLREALENVVIFPRVPPPVCFCGTAYRERNWNNAPCASAIAVIRTEFPTDLHASAMSQLLPRIPRGHAFHLGTVDARGVCLTPHRKKCMERERQREYVLLP